MGKGHAHVVSTARLGGAAAGNVAFAVVQVVVGLAIGSVAVLADASHQVVDAVGLLTALSATVLARRPSSERSTFGLGRADALGGLLSGMLLFASVVWIAVESVERLVTPQDVAGGPVVVIGLVALGVNAVSVRLVGDHGDHLSLRAARLHLLTDLAGSAIVVLAGLVLVGTSWTWVDPVASLALCVAVVWSTSRLVRRATSELLDRSPPDLTVSTVSATLVEHAEVTAAHHVHVRALGGGEVSVTAHVVVDGSRDVHATQELVGELSDLLRARHAVGHVTLQVECHDCDDTEHRTQLAAR